ncbi:MAG: class I adenylate-forming enzyme family protein [bacterium]
MLTNLLASQAAERPEQPALVTAVQTLTWYELKEQTDRVATGLATHEIKEGDSVALLLPNCPAFVIGFLALARLGAVAIPLSTELKADEIRSVLQASACQTLLADNRFSELCRSLLQDGTLLHAFLRDEEDLGLPSLASVAAEATGHLRNPVPSEDSKLIEQFTSGTTGQPKRVIRTHAHLMKEASAFAAAVGTSSADRILATVPLSHAHGLGNCLLATLHAGATLVLQERFDRRETLRLLSQESITLFPAVPFIVSLLADTRTREPVDLSALRLCFTAGSALRRETWIKMQDRLGISLRQLYGSTETGALTINLDENVAGTIESVGRPLDGVSIATLDEAGVFLPPGAEGEVAVQSPAAAEHTVGPQGKRPLPAPDGWIRMGDLGRLDPEGRLYLTGRKTLVINVAGRKVNPDEIESVLMEHPRVREAVVVGIRDPYGEEAVKAVVVLRESCTIDELLTHCRERLANYKVPRIVEFRGAIPRCPTGKILRKKLMEPACVS